MKGVIKIFFCTIFLMTGVIYAQQEPSFFIKIPDSKFIPKVTHDENGNRIGYTRTEKKSLNVLINSYEVYSCEHVFKSSQRAALQDMYLIKCNDMKLMADLKSSFQNIYPVIDDARVELLALPNDFGTTGGFIEVQEELNYIRAPEAWDITVGSKDVIIGISDTNVQPLHEDLAQKVIVVYGSNTPNSSSQHGSQVSSMAVANTNNGLGKSAIGYESIAYHATNDWVAGVDTLSLMYGVKVINTAWVSSTMPELYNEVVEDRGVVVVASAGNGRHPGAEDFVYPASFKNVISVSGISHSDETYTPWADTWQFYKDAHKILRNGQEFVYQHNDSVDIVAPSYGVLIAYPPGGLNSYIRSFGTSYASPIVSGTIALMFDVNYCLKPKEVETILKLTAVVIDTLPQNLPYYGKLGAGKLDAYEAVKMSKDMADAFGTVEVKNRILYRPWFYKLATAPYEIKMINNDVSGGSKLKFRARNNIEILSGNYYPSTGGYIDLQIDENLVLDDCPPRPGASSRKSNYNTKPKNKVSSFVVIPTLVENDVSVIDNNKLDIEKMAYVKVYNFFGLEVFSKDKIRSNEITLNLNSLFKGIYILKVFDNNGKVLHTQKIVKK